MWHPIYAWHMFQGFGVYTTSTEVWLGSIVEVIKIYVILIPYVRGLPFRLKHLAGIYKRNTTERKAINLFNIIIKDIVRVA